MAVTQNIPSTRLTGPQTFNFTNTPAGADHAMVTIDRTVSGGLNTLTPADTLTITVDRSADGGTTWQEAAGITCQGGVIVTKGVTLATETLTVGIDAADTGYRIRTVASTPVRIAGTVVYTP
jgi:hypothetical protein